MFGTAPIKSHAARPFRITCRLEIKSAGEGVLIPNAPFGPFLVVINLNPLIRDFTQILKRTVLEGYLTPEHESVQARRLSTACRH